MKKPFARMRLNTKAEGAAVLVEASISMLMFFVFVICLIDVGRFVTTLLLLNYSAYSAADLASKLEIAVDTSIAKCSQPLATPEAEACLRYSSGVNRILERATGLAALVASPPNIEGSQRLVEFEHYYRYPEDPVILRSIRRGAAILRPGEAVLAHYSDGSTEEVEHPTRPFTAAAGLSGWPQPTENWDEVLDKEPVAIVLIAEFKPFVPVLPPLKLRAMQFAYLKRKRAGARPQPFKLPTSVSSPAPTPEQNIDPTATPSPAPTALETPRPTATVSPIPTARPTAEVTALPTGTPIFEITALPTTQPTTAASPQPSPTSGVPPTSAPPGGGSDRGGLRVSG
ncbi:MAG: hypothetical protein K1X83_01100 [Oligoflexia bacterium]|nr:hypothetical protein [Oligoflexia bacterium]